MSKRDWGLGTGDWGHFGKLSASLGIGDGENYFLIFLTLNS
ncbi:MAG: hypothetical protein HEQ19_30870 [Gloeotrichia echinulata CP02]